MACLCLYVILKRWHIKISGMNTQHSVWIMAQMPPFETIIMSKSILFWRRVVLIRDISVFSKDRLCQLSFKVCWLNVGRASMCAMMSSRPMMGQRVGKWLFQWKNRTSSPGLEEKEVGSFRNLIWCISSTCLFQWCLSHPKHSVFQQVQLATGQLDPRGDWVVLIDQECEVIHPFQ